MDFIDLLLTAVQIYLITGIAFGIYFIFFGVSRLDTVVKGSGYKFRFIILPGSILLWPYLIFRLITKS